MIGEMDDTQRMELHLYNTMSRTKEIFQPRILSGRAERVGIYTCGPTVYSEPHIGNLRAYVCADILRSAITHLLRLPVRHVVNITDVGHLTSDDDAGEDKMEKGAAAEGLTVWEVAQKYEQHFHDYLDALQVDAFDATPRATDFIVEQIALVQSLIDQGYTYVVPWDGIYMDTTKVPNYGKLLWPSAQDHLAGIEAWARVTVVGKRHPTDFAVWKFSPRDEQRSMEWIFEGSRSGMLIDSSVRGTLSESEDATRGFPGWHIECSAMSHATLWAQFDIHTGGTDHIPIHHTNEIAQSECGFWLGDERVRYWMHIQFLNIDGKKISKSLGDDLSLPGIRAQGFDPLDLRYFYLTGHYRSFLDFTWEHLQAAKQTRKSLAQKLLHVAKTYGYTVDGVREAVVDAEACFDGKGAPTAQQHWDTLCRLFLDDLHTPQVLAYVHSMVWSLDEDSLEVLLWRDKNVLKLGMYSFLKESLTPRDEVDQPSLYVRELAEERLRAKGEKDFATADRLRDEIMAAWYRVVDTPTGYDIEPL